MGVSLQRTLSIARGIIEHAGLPRMAPSRRFRPRAWLPRPASIAGHCREQSSTPIHAPCPPVEWRRRVSAPTPLNWPTRVSRPWKP